MSHVLISYSRKDGEFAETLRKRLTEEGFDVWVDTEIRASEDWRDEIDQAIQRAAALVVIIPSRARASNYVTYEWAFAWGAGITIVPILRKKTKLHPRLGTIQHIDFTNDLDVANPNSRQWHELLEPLRRQRDVTADGIPRMERVHRYSGKWKITTNFLEWQDQPVEGKDRVVFEGSMFLFVSADGQRGAGAQTGELNVSIGKWSATYQVANKVTNAYLAEDGTLHILVQVLCRKRIKGDQAPPPYREELFGKGSFEVRLSPAHGSPGTLTGCHIYPSGYPQAAMETYEYESLFDAPSE